MHPLVQNLLEWYRNHQRDLPWRNQHNPYQTWLSEIILQQTRVDQGTAYFHKFVAHFPSTNDLANAEEEEVLKLWQGLGYYSRARNLHKTAKMIRDAHNGEFPTSSAELQKLPGIGPYTSAAIASICFNEQTAVVDGNVLRVMSRVMNLQIPVNEKEGYSRIQEHMQHLIPAQNPGDFNQAVMELGALICSPTSPRCTECPIALFCEAQSQNTQAALPIKVKKTKVQSTYFSYFIPFHEQTIFAKHRRDKGIWQNMYDFPLIESATPIAAEAALGKMQEMLGISFNVKHTSPEFVHLLSHRKIHATFFLLELNKQHQITIEHGKWMSLDTFKTLPHSKLVEKIIPVLNEIVA